MDTNVSKEFLKSEYNRDGDSYRSPWSNEYFPEIETEFYPNEQLRRYEQIANLMVQEYKNLYYGDAVSNAYFWDKEDD